jgi:hypothetical protein
MGATAIAIVAARQGINFRSLFIETTINLE